MAGAVMTNYGSLVEEAMRVVHSQEKASTISIQVGSATCEDAAGAGEIFDEFRKHIEAAGRSDIALRRTGCTGRCSREPIVGVLVPGQMPVKHEKVDPGTVHKIFTSHVLSGKPVYENVLDHAGKAEELPLRPDKAMYRVTTEADLDEIIMATTSTRSGRKSANEAPRIPLHFA